MIAVAIMLPACLLPTVGARACSCNGDPITTQFARADFAFVGTPVSWHDPAAGADIRSTADPVHFRFAVESVWKGAATDTLTVLTAAGDASCGCSFRIGERYLVLGYLRDGQPWTSLCSGNDLLLNAMAARYLLPPPTPVMEGATWPALGRDDLLEWMRTGNSHARDEAASLLTGEYEALDPFGLSAAALAGYAPDATQAIFTAHADSTVLARALADLARTLLDDSGEQKRAAAIRALGRLAAPAELGAIVRRGLADPGEDVRAAARGVLAARGRELPPPDAAAGVAAFIASLEATSGELFWSGVHLLRFLPEPRGPVLAYLDSLLATPQEEIVRRTAAEVRRELGGK